MQDEQRNIVPIHLTFLKIYKKIYMDFEFTIIGFLVKDY